MTLSPELTGAPALIAKLTSLGKRVGVGHTLASYDALIDIFNPDRMMVVHVFNAMADLNSREPGVIGAALDRDDFYCSIIMDRIHVSDPTARIFWKSKFDKSKVLCITDGAAVSGLDIGVYQIGSRSIEKRHDRAVLEGTDTLVGSTLTPNLAAKNLRDVTGCTVRRRSHVLALIQQPTLEGRMKWDKFL